MGMPVLMPGCCLQIKKTAYAQSSQIRQIRKKMVEIMTREASSCDLKELVGKFIPRGHWYELCPNRHASDIPCHQAEQLWPDSPRADAS